jgi:hypothetical protein
MTRSGSQAAHNRPDSLDATRRGEVLPFRRPGQRMPAPPPGEPGFEPTDDLARYEQAQDIRDQGEQDQDEVVDYRQRMLMNVIALAVVAFLVSIGVWLADTIAEMERDQDCVMQGRVNCATIELPAPPQQ